MVWGAGWRLAASLTLAVLLWSTWRSRRGQRERIYSTLANTRELPLIFIGGVPRSGTTLMRATLDAHPDVRCGQETRVVPFILQMRQMWIRSRERVRLEQNGVTKTIIDDAVAAFCLEVIVRHGGPAPRLCNKDPLVLKMGTYVLELFPNAKFLLMIRDGRATVHSIITQKVTIHGFDLGSYRQSLISWNNLMERMYEECQTMRPDKCLMVRYEALVLRPRDTLRHALEFLGLPWDEAVLHHERYINQLHGIALSKAERSSDQVTRPVNLDALDKWVGQIPSDVCADMAVLAPMLSVLGYDPWANSSRYNAAQLQQLVLPPQPPAGYVAQPP